MLPTPARAAILLALALPTAACALEFDGDSLRFQGDAQRKITGTCEAGSLDLCTCDPGRDGRCVCEDPPSNPEAPSCRFFGCDPTDPTCICVFSGSEDACNHEDLDLLRCDCFPLFPENNSGAGGPWNALMIQADLGALDADPYPGPEISAIEWASFFRDTVTAAGPAAFRGDSTFGAHSHTTPSALDGGPDSQAQICDQPGYDDYLSVQPGDTLIAYFLDDQLEPASLLSGDKIYVYELSEDTCEDQRHTGDVIRLTLLRDDGQTLDMIEISDDEPTLFPRVFLVP